MTNIERIRQALGDHNCGAMLITSPTNRLFATGFSSSAGMLLVTAKGAWFFIDGRYIESAAAAIPDAHVSLVTKGATYEAQLNAVFAEHDIKSAGFEDGAITYSEYLDWKNKLKVELTPKQKLLDDLRAVKSPDDLEKIKKAQRVSERAFAEILPMIGTDITEKQLATELVYRMFKNGADDKAFDPIVVSGSRSSLPHGVPEDRKISEGFLTIDFGARVDGWCSDTTRTLCVGKPSDEMVRVYETVLAAQEAGIAAARAGVHGREIDLAARTVIDNAGFGKYFDHGFGHGLGLEVHEFPRASQAHDHIIPAGAVISAEPGVYLPGKFGVRIEDLLYITEGGCENITKLPKELLVID